MTVYVHAFFQKGKHAIEEFFTNFATMAFLVDKIAPASYTLADQHIRQNDIHQLHERIMILFDVPVGKQCTKNDTTLDSQSAIPDSDDSDRIRNIILKIEEYAIPDPGSDNAYPQGIDKEGVNTV